MKRFFLLLTILLSAICCKNSGSEKAEKFTKNEKGEIYIVILETYNYQKTTPSFLTKSEFETVNKILPKTIEKMNSDMGKFFGNSKSNVPVNLKGYVRQYCPYINKLGEKEVFINCMCHVHSDSWKNEIYGVSGGGKCFFFGIINLKTGKFREFMINAPI